MRSISILGATGSIGSSTLKVVRANPEKYQVHSLVANQNVEKMALLCYEFKPKYVVMADHNSAQMLTLKIKDAALETIVLAGENNIISLIADPEIEVVVAAIVGAKGFLSSFEAVKQGKTVLLANKESLVMGGHLFMDAVKRYKATILPIDSEHNALFQCLPKNVHGGFVTEGVEKLILTASGGPFRSLSLDELKQVTKADALKHPKWNMGAKVTIDSSTLMNKGLEFIEAHFLFEMSPKKIDVVIHPQSMIHSLVSYKDGSILAQIGEPDMVIPIAHALGYPERISSGVAPLDMKSLCALTFEAPDFVRFPCLRIAQEALEQGRSHLVAMNAINECLVEAFLKDQIRYIDIPCKLEQSLSAIPVQSLNTVEDIIAFDNEIREKIKVY